MNKIFAFSFSIVALLFLSSCASGLVAQVKPQGADYTSLMTKPVYCEKEFPIIVGHRGAPGHTPEHTMNSYKMALDMGADYIEPDLVMTKDGVLIARHENEISETTNVADKYPQRKKTKTIDGEEKTGWFSEDFTLAEIKNLRARERLPFRSHKEDGKYDIPTFVEILGYVKIEERKRGRRIGIAPEIKHSTYFKQIGLPMEDKIVRLLNKYNLNQADSRIMIQSFEMENLKYLKPKVKVELVQLIDEKAALPVNFQAIHEYAGWVSPHKSFLVQVGADGQITSTSMFVEQAHAAGLKVLPYTFRSEDVFLANAYKTDPKNEYRLFYNLGIDGLFTDFPDQAIAAKKDYLASCAVH